MPSPALLSETCHCCNYTCQYSSLWLLIEWFLSNTKLHLDPAHMHIHVAGKYKWHVLLSVQTVCWQVQMTWFYRGPFPYDTYMWLASINDTWFYRGPFPHDTYMWLASINDIWLHQGTFPHDTYMWLASINDIWFYRWTFPHDTYMWLASINDTWFYRGPLPHDTCMWLASINDIWLHRGPFPHDTYVVGQYKWHMGLSVTLPTWHICGWLVQMTYGCIGDPSYMTYMWLASTNDIWFYRGPFPHDTYMWLASINDIWFYRGPFPHDTYVVG